MYYMRHSYLLLTLEYYFVIAVIMDIIGTPLLAGVLAVEHVPKVYGPRISSYMCIDPAS